MKKKEKEIEGDGYEEEEAVKEGNQTQQRGRVQMKLFFFFSYSKFCKCCYLYFLFYIFLQSHEVYRNNPIIYIWTSATNWWPISFGYLRFLKQMWRKKTRIEILDTNSERHSIVERAEEKKIAFFCFFAYIPASELLVNQQIFEVSVVI